MKFNGHYRVFIKYQSTWLSSQLVIAYSIYQIPVLGKVSVHYQTSESLVKSNVRYTVFIKHQSPWISQMFDKEYLSNTRVLSLVKYSIYSICQVAESLIKPMFIISNTRVLGFKSQMYNIEYLSSFRVHPWLCQWSFNPI